jgi:2-phosphosulfolactate phosphatase
VVTAAFPNLSILSAWLREQDENTCLLCAGWKDHPNLEDTIFAGAVARKVKSDFYYYQDTAMMAETLFNAANLRKKYFMQNSSHYHRLVHLNLQEEVKYCLRNDTHPTLPVLVGGELHDCTRSNGKFDDFKQSTLDEQNRLLEATETLKDR